MEMEGAGGTVIPSRVRQRLLWLIFSLTVLTYLDRLAISAAMRLRSWTRPSAP